MKLADVSVRRKKEFKLRTDSNHKLPASPNLLARKLVVSSPDRESGYLNQHSLDIRRLVVSRSCIGFVSEENCGDNAAAESFFGSLKTEQVYITKYSTREEERRDVVETIEMFYNSKRRHSYLSYLSPMEFEKKVALKINVHFSQTRALRQTSPCQIKSKLPRISTIPAHRWSDFISLSLRALSP